MSISAETRKLLLDGRIYDCRPGETVLDALLRQNVAVPNACRHQVCLTCMMRSLGGAPPRASQTNLKDNLRTQHFFLACGCHPERDMEIAICGCYSEPDMEIAIHSLNQREIPLSNFLSDAKSWQIQTPPALTT